MKILAFVDLHAGMIAFERIKAKVKKLKPDCILCLGDFTLFEQYIEQVMKKLNELKKPVYVIHGNHETESVVKKLCQRHPNIKFAHKKILQLNGYKLVSFGGGGFYTHDKRARDKEFDKFIKQNRKKLKGKIILMTHAPPRNTQLDKLAWEGHVGCKSYTEFIKKYKPTLALSGHLHENFGLKQKKGKTLLYNPGPEGMVFTL